MEESQRVIHHCHQTEERFGVAHSKCSLRARTIFLSVFFHNFSRYDTHHIIKYLVIATGEKLSAIAKNDETHISFCLDRPMESKKGVIQYHSLRILDNNVSELGFFSQNHGQTRFKVVEGMFLKHQRRYH